MLVERTGTVLRYGTYRYTRVFSEVFTEIAEAEYLVTVWRQSDKMAEEDYTVVKNVRGKADVWRWAVTLCSGGK